MPASQRVCAQRFKMPPPCPAAFGLTGRSEWPLFSQADVGAPLPAAVRQAGRPALGPGSLRPRGAPPGRAFPPESLPPLRFGAGSFTSGASSRPAGGCCLVSPGLQVAAAWCPPSSWPADGCCLVSPVLPAWRWRCLVSFVTSVCSVGLQLGLQVAGSVIQLSF